MGRAMRLLRHLAGYLPVKLASALAAFGGVYAFTRLLGPEEYGRYALLVSLLALIHTLSLTWVEASTYRFTARAAERGELARHYRTALGLLVRSLLMAMGLWAVAHVLLRDVPGYGAVLPWLALLLPINALVQMALEAHRAGQRVGRYAKVASAQLLGGFALGALLAWQTGLGAAAPFAGLAVAGGLLALREGVWLFRQAGGPPPDPAMRRAWIGYGVPIAAALVLDLTLSASDRFLIALFLGEAAVGAYAAGYGVADKTVLLFCAWAAMAGSPLVMAAYERGGAAAARAAARGLARTLILIGLPAAVGIALVAEPLSEAMIGEALRDQARRIMPWIAFAGLMNGLLIHYFSEAFQLTRRTGLRAALMAVPAGVNIALNLALLPLFGLMGAVYATLASYALGLLLLGAVGRRLVALPLALADLARAGLACLAMWPATLLVPAFGGWAELVAKAGAGALAYGLMVLALDAGGARAFLRARLGTSTGPGAA